VFYPANYSVLALQDGTDWLCKFVASDALMWVGVANLFIFMICIFANFEQLLLSSKVVFWVEIKC
jgi:hypothetical protein